MNRYNFILLCLLYCGCHTDVARPNLSASHQGIVRRPDKRAAGAGISITVTDAKTGRRVSVERTDATGHFPFTVPPGRYALAVTATEGFAFIESSSSDDNPLVTLSSVCHRLRVKITGTHTLPAAIAISRVSRYVGDTFLADTDRSGQVVTCLQEGDYSARAEGDSTSLAVPIKISKDMTIDLLGYSTSVIQQAPTDLQLDHADLGSFSHSLLDRRVLGLGEANHGTAEFFTYRGKLSLELARAGRLRNILLEADAIGMMAIDDYVMGKEIDIDKAVSGLRFWITDVHEFLAFLRDVRAYNTTASNDAKVHMLGIDAQRLEPPVQYMLAHRATLAISEHEAALLIQIAPDHGRAFTGLRNEDRTILLAMIDRLRSQDRAADLSGDSTRISIAARSIGYQLGYLSGSGVDDLRDQAMGELAAYIIDLGNSQQTALWAHNDHVAREAAGAAKSLGQYLSERYGDSYYPIAFLSYTGSARAWDSGGEIGVIPHELDPPPPFNMESAIINAVVGTDAAWVRLDTATGVLRRWISTPRFVREFGSAYSAGDTQKLRAFPSGIAAVVVIRHATASTPTPTGVRKALP